MEFQENSKTESSKPQSLMQVGKIGSLISELENVMHPILKPDSPMEAKAVSEIKSDLMQELSYIENRLKILLSRIHI